MPRIRRNAVRFEVADKTFYVAFSHKHYDPPQKINDVKLRHQTFCAIVHEDDLVGEGFSFCSAKDTYNWKHGINLAFKMALASMGLAKAIGGGQFTVLDRELWGQYHQAFYSEMKTKAYGDERMYS